MTLPHRTVKLYLHILILLKGLLTRKDNHMIKRDLKDNFQISISGQDTWYDMSVPGSAMDTFCKEGILPDPYYGMNEYKWTEFWKNDFDIRSTFSVSAEEIASEEILLTFYGIDTVADVFLNGKKLGHTENMHRTWVYQVKELVKEGENLLELHIASPVKFIEAYKPEKGREIHFTNTGTTSGSHVRLGLGPKASRCRTFPRCGALLL